MGHRRSERGGAHEERILEHSDASAELEILRYAASAVSSRTFAPKGVQVTKIKPEHSGAKNGGGYWGTREEAKRLSKKARRGEDRAAVRTGPRKPDDQPPEEKL